MSELVPLHLTWLRAGGRSPRTIEHRQMVLERADRELPWGLDEAAPDELAEHMASRDWSVATRHVYDSHLRGYYRWGVAAGHLTGDPMMHLIRPPSPRHVPRPVTAAELALALASAPDWLRMAVMLASYAGLRCSEIARARREDVTAEHIRVVGKGRKVAMVDMAPQLWAYLEHRPPGPLVMFRGRQLDGRELTHLQRYPFKQLGLAVTLHRFRHWFATELLRRGADIRTVQELVRHASLATTQGYTAVVDAQRRAAVRLLPPVNPEPVGSRFGVAEDNHAQVSRFQTPPQG